MTRIRPRTPRIPASFSQLAGGGIVAWELLKKKQQTGRTPDAVTVAEARRTIANSRVVAVVVIIFNIASLKAALPSAGHSNQASS